MSKASSRKLPEGHIDRYDWGRARRGRLAASAAKAATLLRMLEPDLSARFPDSGSVNDALRALIALEASLSRPPRRRGRAA